MNSADIYDEAALKAYLQRVECENEIEIKLIII